jgi:hypothetical protein
MDLNNIQLPASVIADLYRSSLVDSKTNVSNESFLKPEPIATTDNNLTNNQWKHLGENKKNILIVVDYTDAVYLPDEELSFLTNMLFACKLSLADVAIVNRNNYKKREYKELLAWFKSRIVFLFGIDPVSFGLPVSFPQFQIQPFAKATFLFAPSLEEHKKDELLKSKLWVCLRRIFMV